MAENIDFKKKYKELYSPSAKEFSIVDVPEFKFFMVDGEGNPGSARAYQDALAALYNASYTLRFVIKDEQGVKYTVPPLQGLWWADDMENFAALSKDEWKWRMMIMLPDFADEDSVQRANEQARSKDPTGMDKLRVESYREGTAAQILYFGPYAEEGPTIQRLHQFIEEQGHKLSGKHHEIYLSDPRRTAPEKLKTVIRQPFE